MEFATSHPFTLCWDINPFGISDCVVDHMITLLCLGLTFLEKHQNE